MINKIKYLFILIIIGFIIGLSSFSITTTTKKAESKHSNTNIEVSGYTDEVLMNPGKGFTSMYETIDSNCINLISTMYYRFDWDQIEIADGVYNWNELDYYINLAKKRNKKIAFGVMNASTSADSPYCTPKWVFDKGAQIVHDTKDGLCISSKTCAELYSLDIIDENIQDRNNNQTRFFVLTKNKEHREENVKVSMVFSTKHIPGALYQILGLLNTFEINMTKIESRPSEKQLGDYWFWIDTTMEKLNKKTDVFFEILNTKCSYFRILGIY